MTNSRGGIQGLRPSSRRVRVAVDLTPMLPGGYNGGIKVTNLEFLHGLKKLECFDFFFLTATATHDEVTHLLGPNDLISCVHCNSGFRDPPDHAACDQAVGFDRYALRRSGVRVLYCPFGIGRVFPNDLSTVVLVADLLHRDFPASISPLHRAWRERCFRYLQVLATKFQVISEFTAARLTSVYGITHDRIARTYLPVHERFATKDSRRRPQFIYPANYWVHKNHETLVLAYRLYLQQMGDAAWELILTGMPDQRQDLIKALVNRLGLDHKVKFLGYVREEYLYEIFSSASCLVFPSLYEGFGIPLIEAMHFKVPIICGRNGSIPEIAGDAAYYVDARDPGAISHAMVEITRQPELRANLAAAGSRRLACFDFQSEIDRLAVVLDEAARFAPNTRWVTTARKLAWRTKWDLWYYSRSIREKLRERVRVKAPASDGSSI